MDFQPKRFPVVDDAPVWMTMQERVVLYALVAGLAPRATLEIGTFQGGSTMIMGAALDDLGEGEIVCVDPNPRVDPAHWAQIEHRATMLAGPSPDYLLEARRVAGRPFDLALIDGDHSTEGVERDIEGTLHVLADEAYLLFHDVHYFRVREAVDICLARHADVLTDCGLVATEITDGGEVEDGRAVLWGGLRLVRYQRYYAPPPAPATTRALRRLRRAGRVLLTGRPGND